MREIGDDKIKKDVRKMTWRVKGVSPFNRVDGEKLLLNASLYTYVKFVSNRCVQPGKVVSRPANGYTTLTATHTSLYTQPGTIVTDLSFRERCLVRLSFSFTFAVTFSFPFSLSFSFS